METVVETWKSIKGFPFYEVSDLGRVRSIDRITTRSDGRKRRMKGKLLSQHFDGHGYRQVTLWSCDGKPKGLIVHVLVLQTFGGYDSRPEGYVVNHKNGIKTDNRAENLEYITYKENTKHAVAEGLIQYRKGPRTKPEMVEKVRLAHKLLSDGLEGRQIAKQLGMSEAWVSQVKYGRIGADLGLEPIRKAS